MLLSDRRARLYDDIIEAVECLRHWESDGLVAFKSTLSDKHGLV
jgi:hypothetical protein